MSTPVASKRPLSKISASSRSSPRLPVKVSPAAHGGFGFGAGRTALDVHEAVSLGKAHRRQSAKRTRIGRAIVVGIRLGAGDDDAIVEPGAGKSRETGNPPITPR